MHSFFKSSLHALTVATGLLLGVSGQIHAAGKLPVPEVPTIEFELADGKYQARRTGNGIDFEITDSSGARHVFQHSGNTLVVNSTNTTKPGLIRSSVFDLEQLGRGGPRDTNIDLQLDAALGSLGYSAGNKGFSDCGLEYATLAVAGVIVVASCAAGPNPACGAAVMAYLGALSALEGCEAQTPGF
jgi:hypothetical protein